MGMHATSPPFDGGVIHAPILGPDGSAATPTYSHESQPSTGMFLDPGGAGGPCISNLGVQVAKFQNVLLSLGPGASGVGLEFNGTSATLAPSGAGSARLRYNAAASNLELSTNGGAYAALSVGGASSLAATLAIGKVTGANDIQITTGQQLDTATAAAVLNLGNTNAGALGVGNAAGGLSTFQVFINQGGATLHGSNAGLQIASTTANRASGRYNQYGANAGVPGFTGFKSRGVNVGDLASVADGDILARMTAIGVAGDNASIPLAGFVDIRVPTGGTNATWVATDFSVSLVPLAGPINSNRQVSRITSEAAFELIDGTTAAVAPANKGDLRYNNTTKTFQVSVDGGAWTSLSTGGVSDLQTAYAGGNTIATTDARPIAFSNAVDATDLLTLTRTFAGAGVGLNVSMGATTTGNGVTITMTAGATGLALLASGGSISSPGAGANSERFGSGALAAGINAVAVGNGATAPGNTSVAIGKDASSAQSGIAIGRSATSSARAGIAIGDSTTAGFEASLAFGEGATTTAAGQCVFGSDVNGAASNITDFYMGNGVVSTTPVGVTVHATGGSGAGIAGAALNLAGGISGDAATAGGSIVLKVAKAGTGTVLTTALTIANTTDATFAANVTINGKLTVTGLIDPTAVLLSGGTDLYFQSADGSTAAVAPLNQGRIRYLNGTGWQLSNSTGAYSTAVTTATIGATAFVQGGNAFGATANLGTTDAFDLALRTAGTTRFTIGQAGGVVTSTLPIQVGAGSPPQLVFGGTTAAFVGIGSTGTTARFLVGDGTATAAVQGLSFDAVTAGVSFTSLSITGVAHASTGVISWSSTGASGGAKDVGLSRASAGNLLVTDGGAGAGRLQIAAGTAALPSLTVSGDTDTGVLFPGANQVALTANAATAFAINGSTTGGTLATLTQPVNTTGSPSIYIITGGAHTTLTAGAEASDVNWNLARTVQFATGAIATQRAVRIQAPTYAFVAASTITTGSTLSITGAPVAGANATITNAYALNVEAGGIGAPSGTAALPTYTLAATRNLGMFSPAANSIGFTTSGTLRLTIDTTAFTATLPWRGQNGTAAAPALSFSGDTNCGIFEGGADVIGFAVNGVEGGRIQTTSTQASGNFNLSPAAVAAGAAAAFRLVTPLDTAQTASTEASSVIFDFTNSRQFATGALATQRAVRIQAPTYAFVAASTITTAATFAISGAPTAGTNATITNAYALWLQAGAAQFDGSARVSNTSTTAFTVNQTGGGTNALTVDTTNTRVGIGGAPGAFTLDVTGATRITGKLTVTGAIDPPSLSLSGGTALFLESDDGSTAAVAPANKGRIRYLDGTGWQVSSSGGAYTTLSAGASTLAAVLAAGNTSGANDIAMASAQQVTWNGDSGIARQGAAFLKITNGAATLGSLSMLSAGVNTTTINRTGFAAGSGVLSIESTSATGQAAIELTNTGAIASGSNASQIRFFNGAVPASVAALACTQVAANSDSGTINIFTTATAVAIHNALSVTGTDQVSTTSAGVYAWTSNATVADPQSATVDIALARAQANQAKVTDGGATNYVMLGNGGVRVGSGSQFLFSATTDATASDDAGLGRVGASFIKATDGTVGGSTLGKFAAISIGVNTTTINRTGFAAGSGVVTLESTSATGQACVELVNTGAVASGTNISEIRCFNGAVPAVVAALICTQVAADSDSGTINIFAKATTAAFHNALAVTGLNQITTTSSGVFGWTSSTTVADPQGATLDGGFSRLGAAFVALGNGTASDTSGKLALTNLRWTEAAAPALPAAGFTQVYADSTSHTLKVSLNGAAFVDIATGATDVWTRTGIVLSPTTAGDSVKIANAYHTTAAASAQAASEAYFDYATPYARIVASGANATTRGQFLVSAQSSDGSVLTNLLASDSSGHLGVNTLTPGAFALDVNGFFNASEGFSPSGWHSSGAATTSSASTAYFDFATPFARITGIGPNNATRGQIKLEVDSANGSLTTTILETDTTGNVGIGATPGAFKLDVSGSARVQGKLTVTGIIDPTALLLSSGTDLYFQSDDGSTAAVAPANKGRIRYLDGTGWQFSSSGGAYATVATGTGFFKGSTVNTYSTGLGLVSQLVGPSDQPFTISGPTQATTNAIKIQGASSSASNGGAVQVIGGNAGTGSGSPGGAVFLTGGIGDLGGNGGECFTQGGLGGSNSGSAGGRWHGQGGQAGSSGAAGPVLLEGGIANEGNGGSITIAASSAATGTAATHSGGSITLTCGVGTTAGASGSITGTAGASAGASAAAGDVVWTAGAGGSVGGFASLVGGAGLGGGRANLMGGAGTAGDGGEVRVLGGTGVGTDRASGGVTISTGDSSGTATSTSFATNKITFKAAPTQGTGTGTNTAASVMELDGSGISSYRAVATKGWGAYAIYGSGRSTAQTASVATVATYTVGAADGSFLVSANVNVTTSTTHNFTVTVTYTDETNTAQTLTLTFSSLAGTLLTAITNVTGAGPYSGAPLQIRCKTGTAITVGTTGTFTTVTYNVEGLITQVT